MKLMVCYDGSDASKAALRVAQGYAQSPNASVQVVASVATTGTADWGGVRAEVEKAGGTCVETIADDDQTDGESLVAYAEREGVDPRSVTLEVGELRFAESGGSPLEVLAINNPATTALSTIRTRNTTSPSRLKVGSPTPAIAHTPGRQINRSEEASEPARKNPR